MTGSCLAVPEATVWFKLVLAMKLIGGTIIFNLTLFHSYRRLHIADNLPHILHHYHNSPHTIEVCKFTGIKKNCLDQNHFKGHICTMNFDSAVTLLFHICLVWKCDYLHYVILVSNRVLHMTHLHWTNMKYKQE